MPQSLRIPVLLLLLFIRFTSAGQGLSLEVDGRKEQIRNPLVIYSGYHDLIFYFPESAGRHYQYRLSGLEKDWKSTPYPVARYTNLPGAEYRFEGRILNGPAVVKSFTVPFTISEDFWEKWWFWPFLAFMAIVFISMVIYFWFLYDLRQKLKVEEIRQRIAADLHDEVGANLSSITFLAALLNRKIPVKGQDVTALLEKIARNSKESATLINDTIWALNPQYDSFEKLADKMKNFASEFLSTRDIALSFDNQTGNQSIILTIDQRRNAYLVFKEIINNIVKHADATKVQVSIRRIEAGLQISVSDNGRGFDPVRTFEGNGLKNYEHRSRNGEIKVEVGSQPGSGATVTIKLWLKNHHN